MDDSRGRADLLSTRLNDAPVDRARVHAGVPWTRSRFRGWWGPILGFGAAVLPLGALQGQGDQGPCDFDLEGNWPLYDVVVDISVSVDNGVSSSIAVTREGHIVAGTGSGTVYFIDSETGFHKEYKTNGPVRSFISVLDDSGQEIVVVGSDDNLVHVLSPEGERLIDPITTPGDVVAAVAATKENVILVGSEGGGFHFLIPDGAIESFGTDIAFSSSPLVIDRGDREIIVIGGGDGYVYFFDTSRRPITEPFAAFQMGGTVYSSPALTKDGQSIVVGSDDGKLYSLDLSGRLNWAFETDGAKEGITNLVGTQEDGDKVYFGPGVSSSPAVIPQDGTIVFGGDDGMVYFLHPDGSAKASFQTGGAVIASPHVLRDGTVVIGSSGGRVYFFCPDGALKTFYEAKYRDVEGRQRIGVNNSTPTSFMKDGKEYVAIGTGGGHNRVLIVSLRLGEGR